MFSNPFPQKAEEDPEAGRVLFCRSAGLCFRNFLCTHSFAFPYLTDFGSCNGTGFQLPFIISYRKAERHHPEKKKLFADALLLTRCLRQDQKLTGFSTKVKKKMNYFLLVLGHHTPGASEQCLLETFKFFWAPVAWLVSAQDEAKMVISERLDRL